MNLRTGSALTCLLALSVAVGCGGASSTGRTTPDQSSAPPPSGPLAPLRPTGAEPLLSELSSNPSDGSAYARAATFYSTTDASGMAILWGVTWGALGLDGSDHAAVARAIATTLRDHVAMPSPGTIATSLAPGATPVLASGSVMRAPIAHLFETRALTAAVGWSGEAWTLRDAAALLRALARGAGPGTAGLEGHVEVLQWLARAEAEGQLEPFATWLVGPAFPEELAVYEATHAAELTAMRAWVASHAFSPSHAVLPDDLVAFP